MTANLPAPHEEPAEQLPLPEAPARTPRRIPPQFKKPVARGLGTVQPMMLEAGIWAAKHAPECTDRAELASFLKHNLPYNSSSVRERYAATVLQWSYGDATTFSLPQAVWKAYSDENLLDRVIAAVWLERIPPLRQLLLEELLKLDLGSILTWDRIQEFIERNAIGGSVEKNRAKIPLWLSRLGFIVRRRSPKPGGPSTWIVSTPAFDRTAFLILVHAELAPTPRTVAVGEILAHPFWRCLGGREPQQVRDALAAAAAAGAIDRFVQVDQLEQATTRYSLDELLARKVRL